MDQQISSSFSIFHFPNTKGQKTPSKPRQLPAATSRGFQVCESILIKYKMFKNVFSVHLDEYFKLFV